ncbi:MAG: FeoB-associated Cys-rich membrane protein [Lachnospiraceae bacterium]|nr:FeoB-associated Cys-rich membrane protein [Lachnospiraceae bacterium]MCI8824598.1 FeoB-associated Cys-rich membrane protein [Lachnospiraceae bacterium]MCI9370993.1 FeoB-associated Cys-rich membrane protein [Lachnospiraceae bacterium]MDE7307790.1 FeoB-associated Cys-rich membrane protein [Lachnospiraceae bacterium]
MGTVFTGIIVAGIAGLAVYSMVRDRKNGKSVQCGGNCAHCKGHCR